MAGRLRVGIIGCGLIAQVMHLHYLRELADRFEIAAVCDVSEELRAACAREYRVPEQFASWQEVLALRDLRLLRITTLESPIEPYVQQYNLRRGGTLPKDLAQTLSEDDAARLDAAVPDADALSRWAYRSVLLDSLVHEFNAMRGVMGEPDSLEFADIRDTGLTAIFKYGAAQCILAWVDLPGIARYSMEFA